VPILIVVLGETETIGTDLSHLTCLDVWLCWARCTTLVATS
jgi:hypothetical protein